MKSFPRLLVLPLIALVIIVCSGCITYVSATAPGPNGAHINLHAPRVAAYPRSIVWTYTTTTGQRTVQGRTTEVGRNQGNFVSYVDVPGNVCAWFHGVRWNARVAIFWSNGLIEQATSPVVKGARC